MGETENTSSVRTRGSEATARVTASRRARSFSTTLIPSSRVSDARGKLGNHRVNLSHRLGRWEERCDAHGPQLFAQRGSSGPSCANEARLWRQRQNRFQARVDISAHRWKFHYLGWESQNR